MAIKTKTIESKNPTQTVRRDTVSGKFVNSNGDSVKNQTMSKADQLTLRAWKKTYENHQKKSK